MPNEPLVTDGHLRRFRFDERLLFGRRFFTPFGRGGRLAYSGATSGRGTTAGRSADTPTKGSGALLRTEIHIPDDLSRLLLRLASGDRFAEFEMPEFPVLRFGGVNIPGEASKLKIQRDRLVVTVTNPWRYEQLFPIDFAKILSAEQPDGYVVTADYLLRAREAGKLELEFGVWQISGPAAPSLWLGELDGRLRHSDSGNLIIESLRDDGLRLGYSRHFRFNGEYVYFLVQDRSETYSSWRLLIDTRNRGAPSPDVLAREFLLLQFVLGRSFELSPLLGMSVDGRIIASHNGLASASHRALEPMPPVPFERDNESYVDEAWAPLLFERVSHLWNSKPLSINAYQMAFVAYLDSSTNYLDADYLRLQVALEAFAYWDLRNSGGDEKSVVKDRHSWKKWVKDNADTIRSFAAPGFAESLYNKVIGVYRLSSGRVVASAFIARGLPLLEGQLSEVEHRDVVVHQGMMSPGGNVADQDLLRIAMIRSLLIALVCKSVEYDGAIRGWETGNMGRPIEPDEWWRVSDNSRELAAVIYSAQ